MIHICQLIIYFVTKNLIETPILLIEGILFATIIATAIYKPNQLNMKSVASHSKRKTTSFSFLIIPTISFLLTLMLSFPLFAQQERDIKASSHKTVKKKLSQEEKQKEIGKEWLKSMGRKKSTEVKIHKPTNIIYSQLSQMEIFDKYKMMDASEFADREIITQMANSYRLNGHMDEAAYWYARISRFTDNPRDLLNYAIVLKKNGKCEDAMRWHNAYKEKLDSREEEVYSEYIADCDEIKTFNKHNDVEVNNMLAINTEYLDFSPSPYHEGLMFTSTRGSDRLVENRDSWGKANFTDLYYVELNQTNNTQQVNLLQGDVIGMNYDGIATFDQSQTIMLFTRNSMEGKSKNGLIDLKLYMAYNEEGYWTGVKSLPFNSEEFATCHPTLSSDGTRLYFASDRPGGFGGMDIYVSSFHNKAWTMPVNLGPSVNSAEHELFPFIAKDNTLYFSSNGHRGMGQLDIFKVTKTNDEDEESWNDRENMGFPFNSENDDFGFYINQENNSGFLSSNRIGGKGGDDIYSWKGAMNLKSKVISRTVCVNEASSEQGIEDASVFIYEKEDSVQEDSELMNPRIIPSSKHKVNSKLYTTNEIGQFSFPAKSGMSYIVQIEKKGYKTVEVIIPTKTLMEEENYCIQLVRE